MRGFDVRLVVDSLPLLLRGALVTVEVSALGLALAALIAVPVAFGRLSRRRGIRAVVFLYLDVIRGTPLLLQLFAIFYLPPLLGLDLSPFASGVIALGLNGGAYTAEVLRGGIQALPRGQTESGRALGMSALQSVRRIVLPQVVVDVLPALANEAAALIKASSLVSALALVELTRVGYQIVSRVLHPTEIYVAVGALYLGINALVGYGAVVAQRRLGAYRVAAFR
ncbi:MAG TPA: amino acid ABC transporter permease [Methylomirabilota bacterium]|jgi:His/Glu/Gln/Arg/opine family amino acid ABC transporter permease subunit|nr:amino acid ABC transporter permease [Methylomirabilota bacterium]